MMMRYFGFLPFLSMLCACGGNAAAPAFGVAAPDRMSASVARFAPPPHPDRRRSWISPALERTQTPLLFVSDAGTADVYIYNVKTLKVIGTITGFAQPQGECSDNKGNVWVTDASGETVYELSHRGHLENELVEKDATPVGCAWDPATGNLAVMSLLGVPSQSGGVLLYLKGSQTPRIVQNSKQFFYNFGGYDGSGNLFFDGRDANGNFMLSELPKGKSSAHTVAVTGGTIYFPGMVQWDAAKHEFIVGDQSCGNLYASCLYSVKIAGKIASITGETKLQNSAGGQLCDLVQGVLFNKELLGSDNDFCSSTASATYIWPYPRGGAPTRYNDTTDSVPVGAALSR
jgi:hypothetical protein